MEQTKNKAVEIASHEKFAIFQTGGKQYQAVAGKTIAIEKIEGETGTKITFNEVLLRKTAVDKAEIGQPFLNTPIVASIVKQDLGPKIVIFKFKRRKKQRTKSGHRQQLTIIRIEEI